MIHLNKINLKEHFSYVQTSNTSTAAVSGQWQTGAFKQFTKNYATVTHTMKV